MNLTLLLFLGLTVYVTDTVAGVLNNPGLAEELYNSVIVGDYSSAVVHTLELQKNNEGYAISNVVERLLLSGKRNTIEYAYKLWSSDGKEIVKQHFPIQFRIILDGNSVKFINKRDNLAIKLALGTDSANDRLAYGDKEDKTSERISWKLVPIWENNRMFFKIVNIRHNQNLKLEVASDNSGEHRAWGADESDTYRHQWYLHPIKVDNDLLFFIYNREYNQALKLGRAVDSDGDRIVWGHNGNVFNNPDHFGWYILPY